MRPTIAIRRVAEEDLDTLALVFAAWGKEPFQLGRYLAEQQQGQRVVLVAWDGETAVGYITVVWNSSYEPFRQAGLPEIVDLNVVAEYRRQGIGTRLIHAAERVVALRAQPIVGISVEQSPTYAAANGLYPQLGYVPDGRGTTPHDHELHLVKRLALGR